MHAPRSRPAPASDAAPLTASGGVSDALARTDVAIEPEARPPSGAGAPASLMGIASGRDASGAPIHRGWAQVGSHHRWMEPFVLALLANGSAHGYAIVGELAGLGITNGPVDVGQVYRTLRDLEQGGQVRSAWSTGTGPARRDYELTPTGWEALDEWAAVMKERGRLVAEFEALYLQWVALPRPPAG
jgi:DNA-binding PadR family transcriptional regulator